MQEIISRISQAIAEMEGFTSGASKIAIENNNPGNIRFWSKSLPMNRGFTKFSTLEEGWKALNKLIGDYIKGRYTGGKSPTLEQFFAAYAPTGDGNNPIKYAQFVSARTGIPLGVPLQDYITGSNLGEKSPNLFQVDPVATAIRNSGGGGQRGYADVYIAGGLALLAGLALIALSSR